VIFWLAISTVTLFIAENLPLPLVGQKKSYKLGDLGPKSVKHVGLSCQKFTKFFIEMNEVGMLWNVFVVLFVFLPDFNGSFCCNLFIQLGSCVCQEIQLLRDWLFKLLELQP